MSSGARGDDGHFGPGSVTWQVHSSPAIALVGGLRALIVQALHPLAMAGVAQHSDYRKRPLKRLQRTAEYVAVTTFGDTEHAHEIAARVRRGHKRGDGAGPRARQRDNPQGPATPPPLHPSPGHSV